ncbi:MAG: hypothetical protein AAF871_03440 [Pseudomonadota bacterium]
MDSDIVLVVGILIGALAFPSLIGSFSGGRSPRNAIIMGFIGGALIVTAVAMRPGGYSINEVPQIIIQLFRDVIN